VLGRPSPKSPTARQKKSQASGQRRHGFNKKTYAFDDGMISSWVKKRRKIKEEKEKKKKKRRKRKEEKEKKKSAKGKNINRNPRKKPHPCGSATCLS